MHPMGFLIVANSRLSDLMLEADEFRLANSLAASDRAATPDRIARVRGSASNWTGRLREIVASRRPVRA